MMCNNPKLDLINMNAYIKFIENRSICSKDIERKQNSGVNQDHNSGTNIQKIMCKIPI